MIISDYSDNDQLNIPYNKETYVRYIPSHKKCRMCG